jgi:DNA-binding transcriptional MerR regulator
MERWLIGTYSGSLKERLRSFDFQHYQKKVPWHILGFSVDFKHTIKAIDRYLDGVDEKDEKDKDAEWNQWNSLSPQKKKEYEDCIKLLKTQQAMLKQPMEQLLPSFVAAVADSGSVSTAVHGPTIQVTPVTSFSGMFDGLSGNNVDAESSHPKKDPAAPYPNPSEWLPDSDEDDSFGTRYRWTEAEEMKLDSAVEKYVSEGLRPKWNLISAEVFRGKRTPAQLAQQWEMVSRNPL